MPSAGPGGASRLRLDAATAAWEQAGDPRSLRALAAALIGAGRAQAAIDLLAAHLAWVSEDAGLLRVRAIALSRAGRLEDAAAAFEALASALDRTAEAGAAGGPSSPRIAGYRQDSRQVAEARAGAGAATAGKAAPSPRHTAAWARAEALDCRLRGRPPAEAAEALRRLLLVPSVSANPYAVALYGRLLARAGEHEAAVAPLLRASAALPADGAIAAAAAFAVRRARGPAAAMPLLIRALRIRSEQTTVLATLVADAVRLRRAGQTRGALIELARTAPNPGPLWNAIRRLGAAAAGRQVAPRVAGPMVREAAGASPDERAIPPARPPQSARCKRRPAGPGGGSP